MSQIKYDNEKTVCACDKFSFLLDDYESERIAHEATKLRLEKYRGALSRVGKGFHSEIKRHNDTRNKLEELARCVQFVIPKTQVSLFAESVKSPRAHRAIIGCINKMTSIIEASRQRAKEN